MISIKYIAAKNKIIEKPSKMYLIIVCNLFLVLCHLSHEKVADSTKAGYRLYGLWALFDIFGLSSAIIWV